MTLPLKYVWYRKAVDLRLQIEALKAAALEAYTEKTEKTDSDISDEVDQGLVSLVDKSNAVIMSTNCYSYCASKM